MPALKSLDKNGRVIYVVSVSKSLSPALRLTLRDGKPKYLADAPRFIGYIRHTAARYRELAPLLKLVDEIEGSTAETGWFFGRN